MAFSGHGFGITWVGLIIAYLCGVRYGDFLSNTLLTTMLFLPSLVVLLSHLITGEEFDPAGLGILPHIKGNIPRYLLAYFFPAVFTAVSALLFFASHPVNLDPMGETMMKALTESGQDEAYASEFLYTQVLLSCTCQVHAGDRHRLYGRIGFPWISSFQIENIVWPGKKSSRNRKLTLVGVVFAAVFWRISLWHRLCRFPFLRSAVGFCLQFLFFYVSLLSSLENRKCFPLRFWPEAALMLWLRFRCILQRAAPAC